MVVVVLARNDVEKSHGVELDALNTLDELMSLLIAHETVKPSTWKMSVAVKSRTILPSASRPFAWAVAVVQFSAVRANQKQPEELHVTSIIATAMVDIAGNNSSVPLVVRSMVGNQSQSAQNKHSGPIFPVCLSLVSIQSRCGLWRLGRMETCLHIDAPLFPSIIDPTDPTELQRRRQAVSQAQPGDGHGLHTDRGRPCWFKLGHAAFASLSASTDWTISSGHVPETPDVHQLPEVMCVHVCIQISIVGILCVK